MYGGETEKKKEKSSQFYVLHFLPLKARRHIACGLFCFGANTRLTVAFSLSLIAVKSESLNLHIEVRAMADNENFREESSNWHLILGALTFVGIALAPVVIAVVQLIVS